MSIFFFCLLFSCNSRCCPATCTGLPHCLIPFSFLILYFKLPGVTAWYPLLWKNLHLFNQLPINGLFPFFQLQTAGKVLATSTVHRCEHSLGEISSSVTVSQRTSTFRIQRLSSVHLVRYFPPPGNFRFPSTLGLPETFAPWTQGREL